ncbi:Integral membrane protein DUF95 [[Clostridium] sordellii]|uniref:stage II sporulation protein M n=1 Tax=Paraclostridium sordellii TaxID=1505 RepID=UPI0005DC9C83|nr:Integral membrane protein DUF95 [[Clostridium] sordellii] [Paeniclostridium sordellii]CEP44026.1 Integral membrane protein DUF95 [[Clostridium] sordellii] [Paeniclostridium sordellii]
MTDKINDKFKILLQVNLYFIVSFFIAYALNINSVKPIINPTKINSSEWFFTIISRNTISFLFILSSILLGKCMINIYLLSNGAILGLLVSKLKNINYLLLILPHGVVEIPIYITLCYLVIKIINNKYINKSDIKMIFLCYLIIILAALIESFITPYFIQYII